MYSKLSLFLYERKWLVIYTLISIALLYLIFAPAMNFLYYGGDDYRYAFGNPGLSCRRDEGFSFMVTVGRPLQAYMDCLSFRYAYTLERMRDIRLIAVLLMGCSMGLIADWLRTLGVSLLQGFLIAAALTLIPHLYGDTLLTGALSLPVPILLTVIAYRAVQKSWLTLGVIALLFALLSYPAMVFFYSTLMLTKILFSSLNNWEKTRREIIREGLVFLIACVIFFAWAYFNMRHHGSAPVPPQYQLTHPNFYPVEMISRLWVIANFFNPNIWALLPRSAISTQGLWISIMLAGGLSIGFVSTLRQGGRMLKLAQVSVFVLGLLLLCSAFPLVIPHFDLGSRLFVGTVSSGIILVIWALYQWSRIVPVAAKSAVVSLMLAGYVAVQGYQANLYMMRGAMHFAAYMNKTETAISSYLATHKLLTRIHFIIAKEEFPFNHYLFAGGALSQVMGHDKYKMAWCGQACLKKLPAGVMGVTYSFIGEPYPKTESTLVIDNQFEKININNLIFS